jgi:hypothetical protein
MYIVYNKAPYIAITFDRVQNNSIGEVTEQLDLSELNTYYSNFKKQIEQEGLSFDFSRGVYIINEQPNDCILIQANPAPPPVVPLIIRNIFLTNGRTGSLNPLVLTSNFAGIAEVEVSQGDSEPTILYTTSVGNGMDRVIFKLNELNAGNYITLSSSVRVTIRKAGVTLSTAVLTHDQPLPIGVGSIFDNFDEILVEDSATPPPVPPTGSIQVSTSSDTISLDDFTGIPNNVVVPVAGVVHAGVWNSFAGGDLSLFITSASLLKAEVFYAGISVGTLFNLPGTGTYVIPALPAPVTGDLIEIVISLAGR